MTVLAILWLALVAVVGLFWLWRNRDSDLVIVFAIAFGGAAAFITTVIAIHHLVSGS